ncbi:MAG: hypothetical protein OEW84_01860 [Aigarchaeota archaeon]|nr:hypothetical protein [Aigarchaeota archaeon]
MEASSIKASGVWRYSGILLVSVATLILEVSLTRLFSVSGWHHLAFMVVSISLFGLAASGTFLSVFQKKLGAHTDFLLFTFSGLFSLSCVAGFAVANAVPFDPFKLSWDPTQILHIVVYYICLGAPFFFSGLCVAVVLSRMIENASRFYFSNLLGSGLGSVIALGIFGPLSGSEVIVFTGFIGAVSMLLFSLNTRRRGSFIGAAAGLGLLTLLLLNAEHVIPMSISPYKGLQAALRYPNSKLILTRWNEFSRVDVVESGYVRFAPGLSYEYGKEIPPQLGIMIDADSLTAITEYEDSSIQLQFTEFLPMAFPYRLRNNAKTLILGAGGGLGVLTALHHNASSVVATEINPLIVDLVKGEFNDFSGGIYEDARVQVYVSDARSFVSRSTERYDVIELTLTDNVGASSTGIYALTENYLYTKESFEDLISHLTSGGVLSVTRWLLPPPREGPRLVSLAVSALKAQGVSDPSREIAVFRSWGTITLLVKKEGFSSRDSSRLMSFCDEMKFDVIYFPGVNESQVNRFNKFPEPYYYEVVSELLSNRAQQFEDEYLFDVTSVSDDMPFFFHFFKWDKIIPTYESMGKKWQPFVEGGYLAPVVLLQALALTLVFVLLPAKRFGDGSNTNGKWRVLSYFLLLGFGYMFVEVVLIQRFILLLGPPVYAFSFVLAALLTSSGLGSLFSERLRISSAIHVCVFIAAMLAFYVAGLHVFLDLLLHLDFGARVVASLVALCPLGFFMGAPFPLGARLVEKRNPGIMAWAWAVNGSSSVLGSVLSMIIAVSWGFTSVLLLSTLTYLAAAAVMLGLGLRKPSLSER